MASLSTPVSTHVESLRKAIENLINAKLHDCLAKPGGLDRLAAHRSTGVASFDVRNAERQLEKTIAEVLTPATHADEMHRELQVA